MREHYYILFIPNMAQVSSNSWTSVAETKELFAEIKLSGEKRNKSTHHVLEKAMCLSKGKILYTVLWGRVSERKLGL